MAAAMGSFARANYDYVSIVNKALEEEKGKNVRLQIEKETV